jgi:4-hydroxy-3-polyprenylbenzoate decarboxylase
MGSHMGVDATRKMREEGYAREWPKLLRMDPAVIARVDKLMEELGNAL